MKKNWICLLAVGILLGILAGCGKTPEPERTQESTAAPAVTEATMPTIPATTPPEGDPKDVTCKGSYTGEADDTVVAYVAGKQLTNEELQAWYWAAAAEYLQSGSTPAPDFSEPLDTQSCPIDDTVGSWQQYFLRQALNSWHTSTALIREGETYGLPKEEAYDPNLDNYAKYLTEQPALKYLYRYADYEPNSMHQAYLQSLPELLESLGAEEMGTTTEATAAFADTLNRGYMYFTDRSYFVEPTPEEIEAYIAEQGEDFGQNTQPRATLRHILLVPEGAQTDETGRILSCSEDAWNACMKQAESLISPWTYGRFDASESMFADLAHRNSADAGSADDGGAYRDVVPGQLIQVLNDWCFDASREPGDMEILRSDYGLHILYYSSGRDGKHYQAERDLIQQGVEALLVEAREMYPMQADYSAMVLGEGKPAVSLSDVLYPDLKHQRFPEIPLYLQQDYPGTMYGYFELRTNGCGITTMAMVASYLADDELTPPEMCARFGKYSLKGGTDAALFEREPALMGFYVENKTYDPDEAVEAMKNGRIVVTLERGGYWTGGGHYLALEKYFEEDDTVQVRDSNIYNYGKLKNHMIDRHTWYSVLANACGYWIFEPKVTSIAACSRCGQPEGVTQNLLQDTYYCHKCIPAQTRREAFLTGAVQ